MRLRILGRTNLRVSVICHGTWSIATRDPFWDGQDRRDSIAAIRASIDAGVNFFDTAPQYGGGESEEILGEALQDVRDRVVIATKLPPAEMEAGPASTAPASRPFPAARLRRAEICFP